MRGKPTVRKEPKVSISITLRQSTFNMIAELMKKRGLKISNAIDLLVRQSMKETEKEDDDAILREPRSNYLMNCSACGVEHSNANKICPGCGYDRFKAEQEKAIAEVAEYNKARGL